MPWIMWYVNYVGCNKVEGERRPLSLQEKCPVFLLSSYVRLYWKIHTNTKLICSLYFSYIATPFLKSTRFPVVLQVLVYPPKFLWYVTSYQISFNFSSLFCRDFVVKRIALGPGKLGSTYSSLLNVLICICIP